MNVACRIWVWNWGWIWIWDGWEDRHLVVVMVRRRDGDGCVIVREDGRDGGGRIRGMVVVAVCSMDVFVSLKGSRRNGYSFFFLSNAQLWLRIVSDDFCRVQPIQMRFFNWHASITTINPLCKIAPTMFSCYRC